MTRARTPTHVHLDERRGALLRSPDQCLEEVRQGLRGAAGALRALRRNETPQHAERLVSYLQGLKFAAERLQAAIRDRSP
jgi:hypothetical protein